MNPFKSSLYGRLLLWFFVVNLLVLVLGGFLTRRFIEYTTEVEINWSALAQSAGEAYDSGGVPALQAWAAAQRQEGIDATLFENGQPLTPMRSPSALRQSMTDALAEGRDMVMQPYPRVYLAVQQVAGGDGKVRQLVALSRTHVRMNRETRDQIFLAFQFGLSLLLIGLASWWVARSVAKPVEALRDATRRMASGELSTRVGPEGRKGPGELSLLAHDFDAMAERIEALVSHDRGVLQDLSHELRSPLARLHLILDLAQRSDAAQAAAYFRQAEQEIGRLDRMTGEMLALSRLEGGLPGMERERVDLAEVVRDGIAQVELEAAARGVQLQPAIESAVIVSGNAQLLERALDNLLANAIKFSPEGGRIELGVRTVEGMAELTVRDHGPGAPEEELEQLFRPFFRGSNAACAEGHGLGLAIVRRVTQVHGGDIHARNADGGGLEVRLRLPLIAL
ncbi:two-component system, OmpR family, sensor kinase [Dyella sp. OK004]|uniref:sensor histidine kinase n=1 Tax=Dyella sp. OK004 TaxID=1855292 RepID=UPI0008F34737|nr:HAMP domain-containing sensor histidine kinase [Dyella sp. OK004]SFS02715.1 two-component system, OmpR family, sensor kinase [Dyella sp. OK004]